jgi:hypothetical protein
MSLYPKSVARCQHIKVNGTQCGSPALREEQYCYYHMRWHATRMSVLLKERERWIAGLPTMEDANSIQVGLAEVMRLLVTQEVDHKTGALLLYAMQTGSANLKRTSFEPEPTQVVIDRECVEQRPLGATAWSKVEGREYDELETADLTTDDSKKVVVDPVEAERGRRFIEDLNFLTEGLARDPKFLDRRARDFAAERQGSSSSAIAPVAPTAETSSGG